MPPQNGTKKFSARYGNRLVCVRYRYNTDQQRKITTIEVVVDERPWTPDPHRMPPNTCLSLRVGYDEIDVRNTVKAARGKWDARQKVWKLAYKQVVDLGLLDRIVDETRDGKTDRDHPVSQKT